MFRTLSGSDDDSYDDVDIDSLTHSGGDNTGGLEMEPIVRTSPRNASRTSSGSLLYARNTRNSPPSSLLPSPVQICQSRSRTIAQAAYSQLLKRRGGVFRTQSGALNRVRISCWLSSMLAMIFISIFLNIFEGPLIRKSFRGSVEGKKEHVQPARPADASTKPRPIASLNLDRTRTATPPTKSPKLPTPYLSVHKHNEKLSKTNSTPQTNNSFTTWLDFDVLDPPKRAHHLAVQGGDKFVSEWCDLTGTTWYPTNASYSKDTMWQLRAPAFLLPGAAYSGTVYLAEALHHHPSIIPARSKELQFFHERPFRRFVSALSDKTLVRAARERMYARDYDVPTLRKDASMLSFDASPGYLFFSSHLPVRILCVEPWVKLVILLRNPVDRVLEHFAAVQKRGLKQTLEQWIDQEFALMEKIGLISANATFFGSEQEDLAWDDYQAASVSGGVGRSVYVIQIRQWVAALRAAGRDPATALLIVRTDRVAANPATEYARVLRFLPLKPHPLPPLSLPIAVTHQIQPVSAETRQLLEDFFLPYNRRLKRLMRQFGISSSSEDDAS